MYDKTRTFSKRQKHTNGIYSSDDDVREDGVVPAHVWVIGIISTFQNPLSQFYLFTGKYVLGSVLRRNYKLSEYRNLYIVVNPRVHNTSVTY